MKKSVPYDFILDYLPRHVLVKPQFGMYYIYLNKRIMLMLRKTIKNDGLNGVWVASSKVYHQSLIQDLPSLSVFKLENGETYDSNWRFLVEDDSDIETSAIKLCELISGGDQRIGRDTKAGANL